MTRTMPFGSWPSPISAAAIAAGATSLAELRSAGDALFWLEARPREDGRTSLLRWHAAEGVQELTPAPFNVRSRVHEYGGGAFIATAIGVFFVNFDDQDIYLARLGAEPVRITDSGPDCRFADLCWDARRRRIIAVCEDHQTGAASAPGAEAENRLIAIAVPESGSPGQPETLHQGHDFYAAPRLSPDGERLAFVAWDHPNMPWDGTLLKLADLGADGRPVRETVVAGGAEESVQQPGWVGNGALIFISDTSGYWNLYRFDESGIECVYQDPADFAQPPWVFGMSSWVALDENLLATVRHQDQRSELLLLDTRQGLASPLGGKWVEHQYLCASERTLCFIGGCQDGPAEVIRHSFSPEGSVSLAQAQAPELGDTPLSTAAPVSFPTRDGRRAFAYHYAPAHPEIRAPIGEKPPLVVMTHGGPTAAASPALNLRIQYFTSRGFAVLDVDYRGSSGYGRAYREALDGQWGVIDVTDCEDAVNWAVGQGLADSQRIAIRGGSAGGFTTLCALTSSRVFRAGASHYGIGDLTALARDTHKFESRYLQRLIGSPENLEIRSPINHVDNLNCPVIFFQGTEDRVVPPNQARTMVAALNRKGLPVAYVEFSGEGHGFRQAENVERALASEYAFYCRVFDIATSEILPRLEMSNP